jgi:hypothetical protein
MTGILTLQKAEDIVKAAEFKMFNKIKTKIYKDNNNCNDNNNGCCHYRDNNNNND